MQTSSPKSDRPWESVRLGHWRCGLYDGCACFLVLTTKAIRDKFNSARCQGRGTERRIGVCIMHNCITALYLFFFSALCFAQSDRGTITGTVSDPAGAVVATASVEARNTDMGATYPVATSATGNYTIAELPAGTYELSVMSAGFKKFIRTGLIVQAAQTIRVDATLEVGSATE